jgi:hypothetical protein
LFLYKKDLSKVLNHPHQIDPDHDIGSDVEMVDDAHDEIDIDVNDVHVDTDDDDDGDHHHHDCDDQVEAVVGSNQ